MNFKRNARNRRYWASYLAHALQGFIAGLLVPMPFNVMLASFGYCLYQVIEYWRFAGKRDALFRWGTKAIVDDWPSRDIADWVIGLWCGIATQATIAVVVAVHLWL